MPRYSAFGPMRFSSRKPHGELIYRDMVKSLGSGKNFTDDFNSLAMARVYANAVAFGRCKYALERASRQIHPAHALELLPALEREYGLVPEADASIADRRRELAAAMRIARGASRTNVEAVMLDLFAEHFLAYVTVDPADAVVSTATPASTGVYAEPGTPRSAFRVTGSVTTTGSPITVGYQAITGALAALSAGDRIIIDTGNPGRVEALTVTAATASTLTASFAKPHDAGTVLATGRHPHLAGSKRHNVFVLSEEAAVSERLRRKTHRAARRLLRGVSTWDVADSSGPFRVGVGRLGITTIGVVP